MAEEIQSLLDKIEKEGLAKIEKEREKILSDAKAKASQIVEDARRQAAEMEKKAKNDAELSSKRAVEAIKQSSRDIIISLRNEMVERVRRIARQSVAEAMTPDFMRGIILEIARSGKHSEEMKLVLPKKHLDDLEAKLKGSLANDLKASPAIFADAGINSGLKIGFKGEDILLDFSDEALADMVCSYAGPRIAAILKDGKA